MSVSTSNDSNFISGFSEAKKNLKLKLAKASFMKYTNDENEIHENSTKASLSSGTQSKSSYDNEDKKNMPSSTKFEVNLVNMSPNTKEQEFNFADSSIKKMKLESEKSKLQFFKAYLHS